MPDPLLDLGWSDLEADLGIETPKSVEAPVPPPLPDAQPSEPDPADLAPALFSEPSPDANESDSDTAIIELGGTDEQKKRRRRRRRKKKDGDTAEPEAPESSDDSMAQPSELLRDIIKNWDVPSWDEIVSGLYRPSR